MQVNGFARTALGLAFVGIVLMGGCRSTTDRMRVLEAEKADADMRNKALVNEVATLRARSIQDQKDIDSERARAEAAEKRADALAPRRPGGVVVIDPRAFDVPGVRVKPNDDGGATITLASDVTFKAGRADLSGRAVQILKRVAAALKSTEGVRAVRIEGHTDTDPIRKSGWKSNEELSLARAKMVRKYLMTQGFAEEFLSVDGLGAKQPVESNKTKAGKARNRRVEIILLAR